MIFCHAYVIHSAISYFHVYQLPSDIYIVDRWLVVAIYHFNLLSSCKYVSVWYHPASSMFYLTIFIPLSVSEKLTGTLSGFIARVKTASFGLLCAWREVLILRQHVHSDRR
jgi:hypothetical protein